MQELSGQKGRLNDFTMFKAKKKKKCNYALVSGVSSEIFIFKIFPNSEDANFENTVLVLRAFTIITTYILSLIKHIQCRKNRKVFQEILHVKFLKRLVFKNVF